MGREVATSTTVILMWQYGNARKFKIRNARWNENKFEREIQNTSKSKQFSKQGGMKWIISIIYKCLAVVFHATIAVQPFSMWFEKKPACFEFSRVSNLQQTKTLLSTLALLYPSRPLGRLVLLFIFGRQDGGQDEKKVGRLVLLFIFGWQVGGQD